MGKLRGPGTGVLLRSPGLYWRPRGVPVNAFRGSGWLGCGRRRGISAAASSPAAGPGLKSSEGRALGRGRRARGESWGSGGAISGVVEVRGAVEGRVRGGAEPLRRRGRLECVARVRAAADGRRSVGEAGDPFIGLRRRSWACVPQRERPPGISA